MKAFWLGCLFVSGVSCIWYGGYLHGKKNPWPHEVNSITGVEESRESIFKAGYDNAVADMCHAAAVRSDYKISTAWCMERIAKP